LEAGDLELFIGEGLSGFNKNLYIHDKFIIVDPLGDNPVVVTGTANSSKTSQHTNDENMLVIRGDTLVADVYFGEFLRVFDHPNVRYLTRKAREAQVNGQGGGHLETLQPQWLPAHLQGAAPSRFRGSMTCDAESNYFR
jgi:phosphatidylserine/phosphatidylglycerophosphate/cardiolipin synthase-like enzyme